MQTATELLKIMLESGCKLWNTGCATQYFDNNEENNEEIKKHIDFLCDKLSEYDQIEIKQIKEQLFDLAVENLKNNTLKYRENWYLFDYKGKPLCAIPNKWAGFEFCEFVEEKYGIYLQYDNYFESTQERSLNHWVELYSVRNDEEKLREMLKLFHLSEEVS
ncbi:MAG: hypothetical protein IJV56_08570 [Neisseriaceae bacterium]|nr:hypothetical protein [Neisseriaceae bacterium]